MKLNHLDLQVSDVQRSVAFFEHFTFQLRSSRTSPAIAIMDDGDGFVLVEDEWESAEQFQAFFADAELQKFIGEIGGDMSAEPTLSIARAVASADQF